MRESAEQGVKIANDMATTTATESDLLQAGHVVKERWKVSARSSFTKSQNGQL